MVEKLNKRRLLIYISLASLLMLIVTEVCLHLVDLVRPLSASASIEEFFLRNQLNLEPYKNEEWVHTVIVEEKSRPKSFRQYLGWGSDEYSGKYINVDRQGARKTWNPEHPKGVTPENIYMFGGSTMWGIVSRDDYTIPSHLSKLLNNNGRHVTVFNFGENSYTFLLEVVKLTLLLREGHRPDIVIFYDGANDSATAHTSGTAGNSSFAIKLKETLRRRTNGELILSGIKGFLADKCLTCKAIHGIIFSSVSPSEQQQTTPRYSPEELSLLADAISDHYLKSIELLDRLSNTYGFNYMCFWQPTLFSDKKIIDTETQFLNDSVFTSYRNLYREVTANLTKSTPSHFFDISDALGKRDRPVYIDDIHISEHGNYLIANKMAQLFNEEVLSP